MKTNGQITQDAGLRLQRKSIEASRQRGLIRFGRSWQFLVFHAGALMEIALPRLGRVLD